MIDNKTQRLQLPLPDVDNYLGDDVARLQQALNILDNAATVGSDGKIPVDQLPAVAITDTFPVDSEAAMLALNAQPGDVAIRSDVSKSFILMTEPASVLGNWRELVNDALSRLIQFSGSLTATSDWSDVPSHGDAEFGSQMNSQAQALLNRTRLLKEAADNQQDQIDGLSGAIDRGQVWVSDYPNLKDAINALPASGGVVMVPTGRFYAGDWNYNTDYMSKDNVTIKGVQMPGLSSNADRLEGGSVIYGRFNAFAHNFSVEDVGFDMGKHVMDTYYPGKDSHTADHPLGGTWDAFAFAQPNMASPLPGRRGFRAQNVIGLLRDPQSVGHAMLFEGIDGGSSYIDNAVGVFGVHALVIKSRNVNIGTVAGYAASVNCVIIKSDTYATGGDLIIGAIDARRYIPNVTAWTTPGVPTNGLNINPSTADMDGNIQIGKIKALGVSNGINFNGGAAFNASDVQIGEAILNGWTGSMSNAVVANGGKYSRVQIGILHISNTTDGIDWNGGLTGTGALQGLSIDQMVAINLTGNSVKLVGESRASINVLDIRNCSVAYYLDDTSKLTVGMEKLINVTTKWGRNPPALNAGWVNFGSGNTSFDVILHNHNVELAGLIKAQATLSSDIATLPPYLAPGASKRYPAYFNTGTRTTALVGVDSALGKVILNDGTAPAAGNYLSLDGINWRVAG